MVRWALQLLGALKTVLENPIFDVEMRLPALSLKSDMISGAHVIIYSQNAEADRAFFRDVLKFPYMDAGHGWLIFGMPGGEAAFILAKRK